MNFDFDIVMLLALFTIGAALIFGIVSWMRAKRAEDHHEGAAVADRQAHEDAGLPAEGTPGGIDPSTDPAHPRRGGPDGVISSDPEGRNWTEERANNPPTPPLPRN